MPHYRLYRLIKDRVVAPSEDIYADTDHEAIAKSVMSMNGNYGDIELWNLSRFVAKSFRH